MLNVVSRHTQNSDSAASVIYASGGQVVSLGGVCLQPSSTNIVGYSAMTEILRASISKGILWVKLLEQQFEHITYIHIPRIYNHGVDSYANYMLDWNLIHR